MSQYTTGEVAKLCGVSVRTVQYYDTRGILSPSALTEGGRRLYSDEDVRTLRSVCFLRSVGVGLGVIEKLLKEEENSKETILLLLSQQAQALGEEIDEKKAQLAALNDLSQQLRGFANVSVQTVSDIAGQMENKKKLRKVRINTIVWGVVIDVVEIGALIVSIKTGNWWIFGIGMAPVLAGAVVVSKYYFDNVDYICPHCHHVFKPRFKEAFFAMHTPTTRKLTCPACGKKSYCVETYGAKK